MDDWNSNMQKQKSVSRRFMAGGMGIFFINGLMVLMTSSILVYLIRDYQLTYEQGGLLLTTQSLAYLLTNMISGPYASAVGRKKALLTLATCFAIGFGGIALMPPLPLLFFFLAVTGLGWGASNNLVNFLVTEATNGDSGKITLIHTCFSIGAFIGPLLVGLSVTAGTGWRLPVGMVAALALLLWPLILLMPLHEPVRIKTAVKEKRQLSFFKQWRYYLFMFMLFFYVGVEIGFSSWLVTYLTTWRSFTESHAQSYLSLLWVSMIIGRITMSLLGSKVKKAPFLLLESTGMVMSAILLIVGRHPAFLAIAVFLLGLSFSAFYGMVVANASYLVKISTLASGIMFSMGGLGSSVLPYLAGFFSERNGIVYGLWSMTAAAGILVILTVINVIDAKMPKTKTEALP